MLPVEVSVKVTVKGATPEARARGEIGDRGGRGGRSGRAHLVREPAPGRLATIICLGGKVVLFPVLQSGEGVAGLIAGIDLGGIAAASLPIANLIASHSRAGAGIPGQGELASLGLRYVEKR